ncbi:MAG: hypothetical protein R3Y36_01000 [Spirochaetales bacterium]
MITVNKKNLLCAGLSVAVVLFMGCQSTPEEPVAKTLEGTIQSEVLEHKGSALGLNELPVWVETYVLEGITGLEKLPDYTDDYCFVAETTSNNINTAQAWVNGFDIPQTIARNVSTRVEGAFSGASSGSTEGAYGTYFENIVKTIVDVEFSGAKKENDWWVLVRRYDTDSSYVDEYRAYVLYTIEQDLLDAQVLSAIEATEQDNVLGSDEAEVIANVKNLIAESGL